MAALLSALVPGLGHIYAGENTKGRVLVAIDLGLIALMAIIAIFFQTGIAKAWLSLDWLALIMFGFCTAGS